MPDATPANRESTDDHDHLVWLQAITQFVEAWKVRTLVLAIVLLGLAYFWIPGLFKLLSAASFVLAGSLFVSAALLRSQVAKLDSGARSASDKRFSLYVIGGLLIVFGAFGLMSL